MRFKIKIYLGKMIINSYIVIIFKSMLEGLSLLNPHHWMEGTYLSETHLSKFYYIWISAEFRDLQSSWSQFGFKSHHSVPPKGSLAGC